MSQAMTIARTEGGRLRSIGRQQSMEEADEMGIDIKKMWISALDARTRSTHQALDGQTVAVGKDFKSPSGARGPGPRMMGTAAEDINCRCSTVSVVDGIKPSVRRDGFGDAVPYQSYKEWSEYHTKRLETGIIGLETVDNIKMTGISEHLFKRKKERELSIEDIKDSLSSPLHIYPDKIDEGGRVSRRYLGKRVTTVINPNTGNVVTAHKTSSKRRRKFEAK